MKTELKKLEDWLIKNHIKHKSEQKPFLNGWGILVTHNHLSLSFITHDGSYGHERGLIEMWDGEAGHDVEGWLNAEQCKRRIKKLLGLNRKK